MTAAPAAPVRRLAPLAVAVLAAHVAVLRWGGQAVVPATAPAKASFATRTIAAAPVLPPVAAAVATPAPAAPVPAALAPAALAPAAPSRPRPALRPVAQVAPQAPAQPASPQASSPVAPAPLRVPPSMRLHYDVQARYRGLALQGEGELLWRQDGQDYEAQLEVRSPLLGTRRQRSTGHVTAQGLAPLYFLDKARSEQATHFDREGGRVTFSNNKPDAPLEPGVQDRLSVLLQLGALIGGAPQRYGPGTQVAVPTASTSDAETWWFSVEGEEELQLPGGTVRALKLQRLPRKPYDQRIELWLAPHMDYAPVRIRLTNPNGDTVDQRWSSTDKG